MIKTIIKNIIKREGGYVNHPADRGGPKKYGITAPPLTSYLARKVDKNDIKNLSKQDAYEIYYHQYYQQPKINMLPELLQELMLDMSVNHGPRTAIKLLQRLLKTTGIDGIIGPNTLNSLNMAITDNGEKIITNWLVDTRVNFYERIVKNDETQRVFLAGWIKRAETFRQK